MKHVASNVVDDSKKSGASDGRVCVSDLASKLLVMFWINFACSSVRTDAESGVQEALAQSIELKRTC